VWVFGWATGPRFAVTLTLRRALWSKTNKIEEPSKRSNSEQLANKTSTASDDQENELEKQRIQMINKKKKSKVPVF
jgi:hypothetical protein